MTDELDIPAEPNVESWAEMSPAKRKERANILRREALELDDSAAGMRTKSKSLMIRAVKLRNAARKLEASLSVDSEGKDLNFTQLFERRVLVNLDKQAEEYSENDDQMWEWYREQRRSLSEMNKDMASWMPIDENDPQIIKKIEVAHHFCPLRED